MFWKGKGLLAGFCVFLLAFSASAKKKDKYEVSKMPKALFLNEPESKEASREFSPAECPELKPGEDGAFGYLSMITSAGSRRSGSLEMRCAAEAVRRVLAGFGYRTEIVNYRFPYYFISDQTFSIKDRRTGREIPAFPLMYSANTESAPEQKVSGRVVRPSGLKNGDLVYVSGNIKDLARKAEKWQKAGAVGLVMDSKSFPYNMTGLPVPHMIHSTSWHYGALPGLVVEDAGKLVGKEVELRNLARIYAGRGYDVIGITPGEFENYILIGGHLDSWYMGALDDGTGVALMLRLAELLKDEKPGRTGLIFAAFDGEELGLFGSRVFCERFGPEKIKAMLNLDMVSVKNNFFYKDPARAKVMPKVFSVSPELMPLAKEFYGSLDCAKLWWSLEGFAGISGGRLPTDLEWFWSAGVPGIFVYTPDRYYHTELDNMRWMDAGDLEELARASASLVRRMAAVDIPRPPDRPQMEFEFHRQDDGAVVFELHLSRGDSVNLHARPGPVVLCCYEQGFEKKVELKRGQGGGYRGVFYPLYQGEYEFVASAVVDKVSLKIVKSMVIADPVKEEPKEPEKKKGGRK